MAFLNQLFGLSNRVALVTGAYGYLGQAMCWALAEAGATVYAGGPRPEGFASTFPPQRLRGLERGEIRYLLLDLGDAESRSTALNTVQSEQNQLDILVNNGFYLSPNEEQNFATDMEGLLNTSAALGELCRPLLAQSSQGRIVNIASMYGMVAPDPQMYDEHPQYRSRPSYNAAKGAIIQLTRFWASFWATDGITVNAISPGAFPRPDRARDFSQKLAAHSPLGRVGIPEDLMGALLLLCSRAGSFITGANIVVDGGWTIR